MARTRKHPATLSFNEFASIDARGARVHFEGASVERKGDRYVMTGKTGTHTLCVLSTGLDRLNAHWTVFAEQNRHARAA